MLLPPLLWLQELDMLMLYGTPSVAWLLLLSVLP
jgi:hypothetical protein